VDAQPGAPQHDDERWQALGVDAGAGVAMTATISATVGGSAW
jgi:hypothetical protein